jgi:Predicted histidine kinase sensor domain.
MTISDQIQEWRNRLEPKSIFDIVPKVMLENVIEGFFSKCGVDMTLRWAEYNTEINEWVVSENDITPGECYSKNPYEDTGVPNKTSQGYTKFCQVLRYENKCINDECRGWDKRIAQEIVEMNIQEMPPYTCWMGLTDYAVPLTLNTSQGKQVVQSRRNGLRGGESFCYDSESYTNVTILRKGEHHGRDRRSNRHPSRGTGNFT